MMLVYVYIGHKVSAILVIPSLSTLSLLHLLNSNTTFAQMSSRAQSAEPSEVWESPKYYIRGDDVQSTLYQASKALEMLDCDYHLGPQITVPGEGSHHLLKASTVPILNMTSQQVRGHSPILYCSSFELRLEARVPSQYLGHVPYQSFNGRLRYPRTLSSGLETRACVPRALGSSLDAIPYLSQNAIQLDEQTFTLQSVTPDSEALLTIPVDLVVSEIKRSAYSRDAVTGPHQMVREYTHLDRRVQIRVSNDGDRELLTFWHG